MTRRDPATGVVALPLATWERDGLKTALAKAGLPADDVEAPGQFFWRFERDDTPAGFGGMELHGTDALLRSIVTLAPVRGRGIGPAIMAMLETEAHIAGCRTAWLATNATTAWFKALGYEEADQAGIPAAIRDTPEITATVAAGATVMMKPLA